MCGICGFLHMQGAPVDVALGERMMDLLRHRGPDGSGHLVVPGQPPVSLPSLFLGHRRLKIIDLSEAARQPLSNEDGTVSIVFNGEIYNFPALRVALERRGHQFRSQSDTETIVHAYEEFGDRCVDHLDGMFAFALWDGRSRRLLLARDRSGKKPLFYAFDGRSLAFASEIKSLLLCPWVKRDVAVEQLGHYLLFGYVRAPGTLYQGILQLPPASYLTIEDGTVRGPIRYWTLRRADTPDVQALPAHEAARRVRELLTHAVEARLISDVPLGALLSGGLDSTIVVGIMSRLCRSRVRTFTVGFTDDASYDERRFASIAARAFGTDHTEFVVRTDAMSHVRRLLWHHDQPYGDSSAIPTYLVSQLARRHVTVVLNGDGGDEVFGGYERFWAALWAARVPGFLGELGGAVARMLPRNDSYFSFRRRIERFVARSGEPPLDRYLDWTSIFNTDAVTQLLRPEVAAQCDVSGIYPTIRAAHTSNGSSALLDQLMDLNFTTYLPEDLHVKVDRMSMANSLEARSPMLDTSLVEFVASLPPDLKIRGGQLKYVLKLAFRDLVPPELLKRRKHGFGVPVDGWFRNELRESAHQMLLQPDSRIRQYLDQDAVRRLFEEHARGVAAHGHRLWTLMNLELWCRMLEDGSLSKPMTQEVDGGGEVQAIARGA
jgi:asparagine synthase (glutamine-hydrolysing)